MTVSLRTNPKGFFTVAQGSLRSTRCHCRHPQHARASGWCMCETTSRSPPCARHSGPPQQLSRDSNPHPDTVHPLCLRVLPVMQQRPKLLHSRVTTSRTSACPPSSHSTPCSSLHPVMRPPCMITLLPRPSQATPPFLQSAISTSTSSPARYRCIAPRYPLWTALGTLLVPPPCFQGPHTLPQ